MFLSDSESLGPTFNEIGNLEHTVLRDEDVLRLQVTVYDPELVHVLEAFPELDEDIPRFQLRQRALGDDPVEELAAWQSRGLWLNLPSP